MPVDHQLRHVTTSKLLLAIRLPSARLRREQPVCYEDHTDDTTHVIPVGNYVIVDLGNYVIGNPSNLGKYVIGNPSNLGKYKIADRQGVIRLIVDGEQFAVEANPDHPGQYQFARISGPNQGYGFATSTSNGSSLSQTQMEAKIRNFLVQIDSETGYIE